MNDTFPCVENLETYFQAVEGLDHAVSGVLMEIGS